MATREEVLEILRTVEDPELGMDIVDLGLLYQVDVEDSKAKGKYSLTSMGCPAGPLIAQDIDSAIRQVKGIQDVELELTFDPPWTPDRMSDDAKLILGFGEVALVARHPVGQEAPGGGVPLRGKQVAPVLADQPHAEEGRELGAARQMPELGDPPHEEHREHGEPERDLVDAKAADIHAGTEP